MLSLARRSVARADRQCRLLSNRAVRLRDASPIRRSPKSLVRHIAGINDGHVRLLRNQSSFTKLRQLNENKPSVEAVSVLSNEDAQETATEDDNISYEELDTHEYEVWHTQKRQELENLSITTNQLLTAVSLSNNDVDSILGLMTKWKEFNTQITPEMHALSPFRRENPQYPPSEFMITTTFEAAAKCQSLLTHLLAGNKIPPHAQVKAYKLCMETWSLVHHSSCGDRSEDILQAYGLRFGGDMDLAPTLDCYKTVLRGHERSCSSYFTKEESDNREDGERTPGEKAWEALNLLSEVSGWDLYLKPDVELYSHAICTMRHGLLDWRGKMRQDIAKKKYNELVAKVVNAFADMKNLLNEQQNDAFSLNDWYCIIRAYADVIALVTKSTLRNNGTLLNEFEDFITTNNETIIKAAAIDGDSTLLKAMQKHIENAYSDTVLSQLNSASKRHGHFNNLNEAKENMKSAEQIFQRMKDRSQATSPFLFPAPTQGQYKALIECACECMFHGYSSHGDIVMRQLEGFPHNKAARLLYELEELHDTNPDKQPIDGSIYASVMWAKCQVVAWNSIMQHEQYFEAADSIEELLKRTEERYNNGLLAFERYSDATVMYNTVFRFYSRRSKNKMGGMAPKVARRALNLFYHLQNWHETSGGKIKPDNITFNLLMKILSDNGTLDDSQSFGVKTLLSRMESFGIQPNEKHYHAAIRAQHRQNLKSSADDSPFRAESLLQEVKKKYEKDGSVKPTTLLYTECISAYGSSVNHNSVAKVLELAKELTKLYETTKDEAFMPDTMFYGSLLDALSKVKDDSALDHCLRILGEFESMHSNGKVDNGPNRFTYTNILNAISKSSRPNSVKMAEELMQRMIKRSKDLKDDSLLPDTVAYTSLLQALAKSREKKSIDRAEMWFREMESQYLTGNASARPNKMTYTSLINCWFQSNRPEAPEKVANILSKMEKEAEDGHFDSKPDAFVYGSIIKVLSRSKADDKAAKIWKLYERMRNKYESGDAEMKPNNVIMTSIISVCGRKHQNQVARASSLKVLLECINEIKGQQYINPSPITFRALLNAVKEIIPDHETRRPLSSSIFQLCCREGHLDEAVLKAFQEVQPELYAKLPMEVQSGSFDGVASKWTRNIGRHQR